MVLIKTGGVGTLDIPDDAIDTAELQADSVINAKIKDANITQAKNADTVLIRCTVTIQQDGGGLNDATGYMPFLGDVVAITYMNDSGAIFTGAAKVTSASGDVVSSTANLADNISERISTGLLNNTALAKNSTLVLTTGTTVGTGATIAIVEIEGKINAVA